MIILVTSPGWLTIRDPRFFQSHDGFEHVYRALAIETSLDQGNPLPRWVPELALGFGYPIFAVYSPLSYYPPAFLALAGVDLLSAVKWDVAALCLACGSAAYVVGRQFGSRWSGLATAACYACAPYTLANAYVRLDLAELSTFPLTALAVAALVRIDRGAKTEPPATATNVAIDAALLAVPLALLPVTHSLSALIFVPTLASLAVSLLIGSVRSGQARERMLRTFGLAAVLALGLSAWFLLPALRWQGWLRISAIQSDSHFLPKLVDVGAVLTSFGRWQGSGWFPGRGALWTWSLAPGPFGELPVSVAYGPLAAAIASVVLSIHVAMHRKYVFAFWLAALVSLVFSTTWSSAFWTTFPRLTQLQFPWRVLAPVSLNISLLAGLFTALLPSRVRPFGAIVVTALALVPALAFVRPEYRPIDSEHVTWPAQMRRELQGGFGTTGSGLFLPRSVATDLPGNLTAPTALSVGSPIASDLRFLGASSDSSSLTLRYQSVNPTNLTLGALYAPPWTAEVDGRSAPLNSMPSTGLQQIRLSSGTHIVSVRLAPTVAETAGDVVSLGALVVVLSIFCLVGCRYAIRRPLGSRHNEVCPFTLKRAIWSGGVLAVVVVASASFLALHRSGSSIPWRIATARAPDSSIQVAAWRPEMAHEWGSQPSIDVLLFSYGQVTTDDDLMVRLRSISTGAMAERRQKPRLGTVSTAGWPADMLFEDHLLLPEPTDLCPDRYAVEFAASNRSPGEPVVFQSLGELTDSGKSLEGCHQLLEGGPTSANAVLESFKVDGLDPARDAPLRPGSDLTVTLRLRTLAPTDGDDAVTFQLLDNRRRVVSQRDSYGNLDLVFSSLWRLDDHATLRLQLPVPADLPTGVYHLAVGLYSPARSVFDPLSAGDGSPPTPGLRELRRVRVAPSVEPAQPALASFGGLFALDRAKVNVRGGGSGSSVHVEMGWQSLQAPPADYTLFVQLLDASGRLVGQQDGPLLGGNMPTSDLRAGEVITESRDIVFANSVKPGVYSVILGWYSGATGERLPSTPASADQAFSVGTVTIT